MYREQLEFSWNEGPFTDSTQAFVSWVVVHSYVQSASSKAGDDRGTGSVNMYRWATLGPLTLGVGSTIYK